MVKNYTWLNSEWTDKYQESNCIKVNDLIWNMGTQDKKYRDHYLYTDGIETGYGHRHFTFTDNNSILLCSSMLTCTYIILYEIIWSCVTGNM